MDIEATTARDGSAIVTIDGMPQKKIMTTPIAMNSDRLSSMP